MLAKKHIDEISFWLTYSTCLFQEKMKNDFKISNAKNPH